MLAFAAARITADGYRRIYAGVHARNAASMKAFRRAGFEDVGTIRHFGPYRPKYKPRALKRLIGKVVLDPMSQPIGRIRDMRTRWQGNDWVIDDCTIGPPAMITTVARLFGLDTWRYTIPGKRLDISDGDQPRITWPGRGEL